MKILLTPTDMIADSYTMIPGSAVRHVDVGSVLNITCLVVNYPLKLDYVIFYHNDQVTHVPQTYFTKYCAILSKIIKHRLLPCLLSMLLDRID